MRTADGPILIEDLDDVIGGAELRPANGFVADGPFRRAELGRSILKCAVRNAGSATARDRDHNGR